MIKVDFHTHSYASPDGGLCLHHYKSVLDSAALDYIAITDHNRIDAAVEIQHALGERVIIGEEILTTGGEIIGLYLQSAIPAGLSPLETIKEIKQQQGLVYIPHPFETIRKALPANLLDELVDQVDIIEVCNGRAFFQNRSSQAVVWARLNHKSGAASSDAHGFKGLGKTFTSLSEKPTVDNLLRLLPTAKLITDRPSLRSLIYPKYHRLRHTVRRLV
ncbi:MAG: PHP domain-containing protein [Candidatus Saccharimonadales bacterium]